MRHIILAAALLASARALADTVTDQYNRAVTCAGSGPVTCTTPDGLSVQAASAAQAMGTINGMAPASWSPAAALAPTLAQQAATLLAGGITVTSTSTPALNGIYAIDATAQANINAVQTWILTTPGTFPTGTSIPWVDLSGAAHVFTSTALFTAFAKAAAGVAAQVALYGDGVVPSPPAMSATIP